MNHMLVDGYGRTTPYDEIDDQEEEYDEVEADDLRHSKDHD